MKQKCEVSLVNSSLNTLLDDLWRDTDNAGSDIPQSSCKDRSKLM